MGLREELGQVASLPGVEGAQGVCGSPRAPERVEAVPRGHLVAGDVALRGSGTAQALGLASGKAGLGLSPGLSRSPGALSRLESAHAVP